ncbi:MAG: phenylpyruvate tautomerase MIF-related protein [Oscillospiraceae bacterium]
MPFVNVQTNIAVSTEHEKSLVERLGPAIEVIPGKVRQNLFIKIEDKQSLYFGGNNTAPCAMVTIDLFGKSENEPLSNYVFEICRVLEEELSIGSDRVYISFTECRHWGANGTVNTVK